MREAASGPLAAAKERDEFMNVSHVSDDSFETEVLKAEGPVLVDFWAEWCGPCHQVAPVLDELAANLKSKVAVAKVNIDDNPVTPSRYGVRGIPTLMIFKNGAPVATKIGAFPKSALYQWVESHL